MSGASLIYLIEGKESKSRANSSNLLMSATQLPSAGNSSDQKPNTANCPIQNNAYDSDELDEDEMLEALIRSEMGD